MRYKIKVYSIWEYGQRTDAFGEPHQEDSLFPAHGRATAADRLFIVCDGMGGHDAGEVASATVCGAMSEYIVEHCPGGEAAFGEDDMKAAISAAFDALDLRDTGAEKKMGTTMTALKLHDRGYTAAHIGDSRIYQLRPGATAATTRIVFRTEDHSLANDLIRAGELTEAEAKTFRHKNVITRAMQPNMERRAKADIHESADIMAGDYFYLCTDGMLEDMDDEDLRRIFSAAGGKAAKKVGMLRQSTAANSDNHTGVIVYIEKVIDPIVKPARRTTMRWIQLGGLIVVAVLLLLLLQPKEQQSGGVEPGPVEPTSISKPNLEKKASLRESVGDGPTASVAESHQVLPAETEETTETGGAGLVPERVMEAIGGKTEPDTAAIRTGHQERVEQIFNRTSGGEE